MPIHYAGPMFVGGVQVGIPPVAVPIRGQLQGGKAWYVCNRSGVAPGNGSTPDKPFASLKTALSMLGNRQAAGDCIYVLPGHAENIDAADWAVNTGTAAGFSIVGLGTGSIRPTFTWTTATSSWLLDTAGVEIANCRLFLAGAHAAGAALTVANPITISANNCQIVNCEIWWGFDADQIVGTGILTTAAADWFTFSGNTCFAETAAAPTATFMTLVGADYCTILGNSIVGATSGTTVGVVRGLTTASLEMNVGFNYMANRLASSTIAFSPLAASTGVANQNNFFVNSGILPITAGILAWMDNLVCNTVGKTTAAVGTAST